MLRTWENCTTIFYWYFSKLICIIDCVIWFNDNILRNICYERSIFEIYIILILTSWYKLFSIYIKFPCFCLNCFSMLVFSRYNKLCLIWSHFECSNFEKSIHKDTIFFSLLKRHWTGKNVAATFFFKVFKVELMYYEKESLNSDAQQFHQILQNEQSPLTWNHWTLKRPQHMMLEIQVLSWIGSKMWQRLNRLMGFQTSPSW